MGRFRSIGALIVYAALLTWRLLMPDFVGLANNGDFSKISGRLCAGDPEPSQHNFAYVLPRLVRASEYCWDSGVPSSEMRLARWADKLSLLLGPHQFFDLRWMGVVHGIFLTGAFALWLYWIRHLRGLAWVALCGLALLVWFDLSYTAYANSFYTDTAAIIGALIAVPCLGMIVGGTMPGPLWLWILYGSGGLLFTASKAQHAPAGFLLAAAGLGFALRYGTWTGRMIALVAVSTIAGAGVWVMTQSSPGYTGLSLFNVVFLKILPDSITPEQDAQELGLSPQDLAFSGMSAFQPGNPTRDPAWYERFQHRTTAARLLGFYLRHPLRAQHLLHADLVHAALNRRPPSLGNFQAGSGHAPQSQSKLLGWWSAAWQTLTGHLPYAYAIWYAALFGVPCAVSRNRITPSTILLWILGLLGVVELSVASLGDAMETDRHLILFHLFTDSQILAAAILYLPQPETETTTRHRASATRS